MKQLEHPPVIALWQINLLRVGYVVMGGGLAVFKWPLLFDHEPWSLAEGTVECLLVGMSLLALLGLRYPVRMLPILLFEVTWKLDAAGRRGAAVVARRHPRRGHPRADGQGAVGRDHHRGDPVALRRCHLGDRRRRPLAFRINVEASPPALDAGRGGTKSRHETR